MTTGGSQTPHADASRSKQPRLGATRPPQSVLSRLGVTLGGWPVVAIAAAGLMVWALSRNTPDAWIGANVKMALIASDQVGGVPIGADARDGRVTLHGAVRSETEREEAVRVATRIRGV